MEELVGGGEPGRELGGWKAHPLESTEEAKECSGRRELLAEVVEMNEGGGHALRGVGDGQAGGCGRECLA